MVARLIIPATLASCLLAQSPIDVLREKTMAELRAFDRTFDGIVGVAVIDLTSGQSFALNGDVQFPQASTIKIPILVRMYEAEREGKFHLTDRITIQPGEAVGGSGRLQFALKNGPVTMTIREMIAKMIEDSDNTATNKCIDLAGMESVNAMLDRLGFPKTRLKRKMMDGPAAERNDENISTPNEMARLVEMIYRGKLIDEKATAAMIEDMKLVRGGIAQGLPLDTVTATKTGEIPGSRSESGIVYLPHRPFVLSVQSAFIDDRRTPVPEVTRIIYRYFEKLARSNQYGHTIR